MTPICREPSERARKIASVILQRLAGGAQSAIAASVGVSESTVSRFKSEHLDTFAAILAHAGLKVVPVESVCVDPKRVEAMGELLNAALRKAPNPASLLWDDDDN